ncbi:hypothetical protein ACFQZ4_14470 [Catellatospora coxensis]
MPVSADTSSVVTPPRVKSAPSWRFSASQAAAASARGGPSRPGSRAAARSPPWYASLQRRASARLRSPSRRPSAAGGLVSLSGPGPRLSAPGTTATAGVAGSGCWAGAGCGRAGSPGGCWAGAVCGLVEELGDVV